MPTVKVYHNPRFLDYDDDHNRVPPPATPIATVQPPAELTGAAALSWAYAHTQHLDRPWWEHPGVYLHARSTSVGDLLADESGALFVVERAGFSPWWPTAVGHGHRLADAARLLADLNHPAAHRAHGLIRHVLAGAPPEIPVRSLAVNGAGDDLQVGDLVADDGACRLVVARGLREKWRAARLAERLPGAVLWSDAAGGWAVLLPVTREAVA